MLSQTDADKVVGILVAGVNPRHDLDDNYRYSPPRLRRSRQRGHPGDVPSHHYCGGAPDRIFFNLFTGHAASAVTNAMAREEERKRAEVTAPRWLDESSLGLAALVDRISIH